MSRFENKMVRQVSLRDKRQTADSDATVKYNLCRSINETGYRAKISCRINQGRCIDHNYELGYARGT